ncbi:NAD(+)/NADH kinase [Ruminococcus sp.]|uniref:NAD(+)/NADH kinase n=1 Tax=Ruminococcus sp. TaxID=41978 RepID=UPI0025E91BAF|nr:NAD(+)/NADH kinase [Ruminococcus sp.]
MKIYLYPNLDKTHCYEYTSAACDILASKGAELSMSEKYKDVFSAANVVFGNEDNLINDCDVIVAIGGDGTILKCSLKSSKFSKPILGINCGRLGFMASLEHSQLQLLDKLLAGEYTLSRRMMLDVKVLTEQGEQLSFVALNDVTVTKADDCKIADFEVSKNDKVISSLRADGVILSTATGSTAYSMSAGGPIIEPEMKCIEFTQICAHSLFARSMILSEDSVMKVKCHTSTGSHAIVNVDGNNVYRLSAQDMVVASKSEYFVDIIDICGGSFFSSINKKLMQPLKESTEDGI